jgi:glutamyl/glutaminyl-tRNA synthetase
MNTRFNPTANGPLHLGHLYLILLNQHAAKSSGGRFVVRLDDDQPYWLAHLGARSIARHCEAIQEDLEWAGVVPDHCTYQSREHDANLRFLQNRIPLTALPEDGLYPTPSIVTCSRPYPYVPSITALKVVQDFREGVNCLIRGVDLVSEFSLYCYFCDLLELPIPQFIYVPKLLSHGEDLADVSKTTGNFKLADLRTAGFNPADLKEALMECCLIDPAKGWQWTNVKNQPTLGPTLR